MTKTTCTTYVCHLRILAGGVFGTSSKGPEEAAQRALREAREFARPFGGFNSSAIIRLPVFSIPAGKYWRGDETGDYVVDYDTDVDEGPAPLARIYQGDPSQPISKFRLVDLK